jgi:hypothetical protein
MGTTAFFSFFVFNMLFFKGNMQLFADTAMLVVLAPFCKKKKKFTFERKSDKM